MAKKVHALLPSERERICSHTSIRYSGKTPGTGVILCDMCHSTWQTMEDADKARKEAEVLIDAERLVAKLRAQGWTKERFAQELGRMMGIEG